LIAKEAGTSQAHLIAIIPHYSSIDHFNLGTWTQGSPSQASERDEYEAIVLSSD